MNIPHIAVVPSKEHPLQWQVRSAPLTPSEQHYQDHKIETEFLFNQV